MEDWVGSGLRQIILGQTKVNLGWAIHKLGWSS